MKKTIIILLAAFALASCEKNRAHETAVSGTVFDHALEGVPPSYRDFLGRGGGYFVTGPEEALGPDAKGGWKQKCVVGLREKGDYAYIIKYLENDAAGAAEYIDIYKPNGDLFLSRYIGKKKAAVLADFPLGAGIDDREYRDELQYDAADMTVQFFLKGKTVKQIRVKPKKAADIGKRQLKIAADWWADAAEDSDIEIIPDEPQEKSGWWE